MAEEKPDKESQTEEPTEHKIRQAEEKGNLPFSRELPVFFSLVVFSILTVFVAFSVFSQVSDIILQFFERPEDWRFNNVNDIRKIMLAIGSAIGLSLSPVLVAITITGIAASMVQNAPRFIAERIRPKLSHISPGSGFSRIFSKTGFIEFLKSVAKLIGVTIIIYLIFFRNNTVFVDALITDPYGLPEMIRFQLSGLFISCTVAVVAIAGLDISWSRISWWQKLRMTKQEIREEIKQTEGNPMVKTRIRSIARDRSRKRMIANVPKATLVIVNPNHFSVALRYLPPGDSAPVVIAKGQSILALRIREIALEHDIPVIENVPLARALYKQSEIDQMIAPEFYQAVAELIRYINAGNYQYSQ